MPEDKPVRGEWKSDIPIAGVVPGEGVKTAKAPAPLGKPDKPPELSVAPAEGYGSYDHIYQQISELYPELSDDDKHSKVGDALIARSQVEPDPYLKLAVETQTALEKAEAVDINELALRFGRADKSTSNEAILREHAEDLGISPDELLVRAQYAGYNLDGLAADIRDRGHNPHAMVRMQSIRQAPGFVNNAATAQQAVEDAVMDKRISEARADGDISELIQLDDPRFEVVQEGQGEHARTMTPGSRQFDDAERYIMSLLANPDFNRLHAEASSLTSGKAAHQYWEGAVALYLNQFGITPSDPHYLEAKEYFKGIAIEDIAKSINTGRWPGNRTMSRDMMNYLTGDAGRLSFMDVSGLPRSLGGGGSRMEIIGMGAGGDAMVRPINAFTATFEIADSPQAFWTGALRDWDDIHSLEDFADSGLRGMGRGDNFQMLALDTIGESPDMGPTKQFATYMAGTGAYVLSGDYLILIGGALGKTVKTSYGLVRRPTLNEAARLTEKAATARLSGNFEEATSAESQLRRVLGKEADQVAKPGELENLAAQIDGQDLRVAQRWNKRGIPGSEDTMGKGADEIDDLLKDPRQYHRHPGQRKAVKQTKEGEFVGGFEDLYDTPGQLKYLDDLAEAYASGAKTPAGARARAAVDDDLVKFEKWIYNQGVTELPDRELIRKALHSAIEKTPGDPAAIKAAVEDALENIAVTRSLPEEAGSAANKARAAARQKILNKLDPLTEKAGKAIEGAPSVEEVLDGINRAKIAVNANNESRAVAMAQVHEYVSTLMNKKPKNIKLEAAKEVPEVHPIRPLSPQAMDFFDRLVAHGVDEAAALKQANVLDETVAALARRQSRDVDALWAQLGGVDIQDLSRLKPGDVGKAAERAAAPKKPPSKAPPVEPPEAPPFIDIPQLERAVEEAAEAQKQAVLRVKDEMKTPPGTPSRTAAENANHRAVGNLHEAHANLAAVRGNTAKEAEYLKHARDARNEIRGEVMPPTRGPGTYPPRRIEVSASGRPMAPGVPAPKKPKVAPSEVKVKDQQYLDAQRKLETLQARRTAVTNNVNMEQAQVESMVPDAARRSALINQAMRGMDEPALAKLSGPERDVVGRAPDLVKQKQQIWSLTRDINETESLLKQFETAEEARRAPLRQAEEAKQVQETRDLTVLQKERASLEAEVTAEKDAIAALDPADAKEAAKRTAALDGREQLLRQLKADIETTRAAQMTPKELDQLKKFRDDLENELAANPVSGQQQIDAFREIDDLTALIKTAEARLAQKAEISPLPLTELQQTRQGVATALDDLADAALDEAAVDAKMNALADEVGASRRATQAEPLTPEVEARLQELDDLIEKIEASMPQLREVTYDGQVFAPRFRGRVKPNTLGVSEAHRLRIVGAREKLRATLGIQDEFRPLGLVDRPSFSGPEVDAWRAQQELRLNLLKETRDSLRRPRNLAEDTPADKQLAARETTAEIGYSRSQDAEQSEVGSRLPAPKWRPRARPTSCYRNLTRS